MSWLTSLFSSQKPDTSIAPSQQETAGKRLLEEPQNQQPEGSEPSKAVAASSQPQPTPVDRPNRNKVIFGAGLAFFAFSLLVTRRAFARRRLATHLASSNAPGHHAGPAAQVSGPIEALEAFNLATVNVVSLSMIATGGVLWYLDINSVEDARKMLRSGWGIDGIGKTEKESEEELEEWVATVLARKEAKSSQASQRTGEK